jgi:hypothetical protein
MGNLPPLFRKPADNGPRFLDRRGPGRAGLGLLEQLGLGAWVQAGSGAEVGRRARPRVTGAKPIQGSVVDENGRSVGTAMPTSGWERGPRWGISRPCFVSRLTMGASWTDEGPGGLGWAYSNSSVWELGRRRVMLRK